MAQAIHENTASSNGQLQLSALFSDPLIADAFRRAERDLGAAFAVPTPLPNTLLGGSAVERELVEA